MQSPNNTPSGSNNGTTRERAGLDPPGEVSASTSILRLPDVPWEEPYPANNNGTAGNNVADTIEDSLLDTDKVQVASQSTASIPGTTGIAVPVNRGQTKLATWQANRAAATANTTSTATTTKPHHTMKDRGQDKLSKLQTKNHHNRYQPSSIQQQQQQQQSLWSAAGVGAHGNQHSTARGQAKLAKLPGQERIRATNVSNTESPVPAGRADVDVSSSMERRPIETSSAATTTTPISTITSTIPQRIESGPLTSTLPIAAPSLESLVPRRTESTARTNSTPTTARVGDSDLVEAQPVMGESRRLLDLPQAQQFDLDEDIHRMHQRKESNRKLVRWLLCFVVVLMAIVGIAVGLGVGLSNSESTNQEKSAETNDTLATSNNTMVLTRSVQDKLEMHLSIETMERILEDSLSPQARAFNWLLENEGELSDYVDQDWRVKQRFALATLFYSTKGPTWKDNTGWVGDSEVHECDWASKTDWFIAGVYFQTSFDYQNQFSNPCNIEPNSDYADASYENLWLWANNLEGELPAEIFWLTNLRTINLDSQTDDLDHSHDPDFGDTLVPLTITGTLSPEFGKLSRLEVLTMAWNSFYGTLSTSIGQMSSLRILRLPNNFFSGTVPSELGLLSNLVEIDLGSTGLGGSLPSEIWQLTKLERLYLGTSSDAGINEFRVTIPSTIGFLSLMRDLDLSDSFEGQIPSEFFLLSRLERLRIGDNGLVAGGLPCEIGLLSSLVSLDLAASSLTGIIPSEIGIMQSLQELLLYGSSFSGKVPTEIGLASQLRVLDISSMNLNGQLPSEVGLCTHLASLRSSKSIFTGTIPSEIGQLAALTSLDLGSNLLTGTIPTEIGRLTGVTAVDLDGNQLSGTIPNSVIILATEGSLSSLSLSENQLTGTLPFELFSLESLGCRKTLMCGCVSNCPVPFPSYVDFLLQQSTVMLSLESSDLLFNGTVPTTIGLLSNLETLTLRVDLSGKIPSELGRLSKLTSLDLSADLSGTIPSELGLLSKLTSLVLSGGFTGSLPSDLKFLESLEVLDVFSHEKINGTIPVEIFEIASLASLQLPDNSLTGSLPTDLGQLGMMKNLQLGENALTGSIPSSVGLLRSLEELRLHENMFTGPVPSEFGMLVSLTSLSLSGNKITGTLPTELGILAVAGALESFSFTETMLSGTIPAGLLGLGAWNVDCESPICGCYEECAVPLNEYFDMMADTEDISITGFYLLSIPTSVSRLRNLKSLELDGITGNTIPFELGSLQESMTSLSLRSAGVGLSGTFPVELCALVKLKDLSLENAPMLSGQIPSEIGLLTSLISLGLSESGFSGTLPSEMALLSNLSTLDLQNASMISGEIPSELGLMGVTGKLSSVYIEGTGLSGTIPAGFMGVYLSCSEPLCGCYAACPVSLEPYLMLLKDTHRVGSLQRLQLSWDIYISSIPTEIGMFTNLDTLYLNNIMGGTIPSELGLLQSLTSLILIESDLSGTFPVEVNSLPNLGDLVVENVPLLSGPIPFDLVFSPALTSLKIMNTSMTGIVPSERQGSLDYWFLDDKHIGL